MSSSTQGLRLIFAGTPDFAAHHLQALMDDGRHQLVAVYTQPDRPAGRGKKLRPSPVKQLALAHDLPVYQPLSLKDEAVQVELAQHRADVMIVVAYGLLLPQAVLDIPPLGCLNVHGSLLPRWRGAAPIQRAIAAGDQTTGVTIMQMDKGLDTGDMLVKRECGITETETSASLHDKLMQLGAEALLDALDQAQHKQLTPVVQDESKASYAEKISKEEARINWAESAEKIATKIRAYNPFPIAYTFLDEARIKVYQAAVIAQEKIHHNQAGEIIRVDESGVLVACGEKNILIQQCQLPNKKVMSVADMLNGNNTLFLKGRVFGDGSVG